MVRMTLVLVASQPRADHLVQALRSLMMRTRTDPACLTCSVWLDLDSSVRYVEEWATEADMERRVRSDIFTWLLAVMEGAEEPPEIRFDFHALSRGLDYVRELRQLPHSQ
jgi:quinol monooxygenase YgiN